LFSLFYVKMSLVIGIFGDRNRVGFREEIAYNIETDCLTMFVVKSEEKNFVR